MDKKAQFHEISVLKNLIITRIGIEEIYHGSSIFAFYEPKEWCRNGMLNEILGE